MPESTRNNPSYLIFAGRRHHADKLDPLYQEFDGEVAFYHANNAINIDPATEFLGNTDYWRINAYDYLRDGDAAKVNKLMADSGFLQRLDWTGHVSPFWGVYSLREIAQCYVSFTNMLEDIRPKAVFGLHENNMWVKLMATRCKAMGIPHYVFQEGMLRHKDQDTMRKQSMACQHSDGIFVWGPSSKRAYIDAGIPSEKIYTCGPMHLNHWRQFSAPEERLKLAGELYQIMGITRTPVVSIFMPLSTQFKGPIADVERIIKYLIAHNVTVVAAFHPFDKNINKALFSDMGAVIYDGPTPEPMILASHLALVQHSTIGMEALYLGTLIAEFGTNIQQSWSKAGVAPAIKKPGDEELILRAVMNGEIDVDPEYINEWLADNLADLPSTWVVREVIGA